MKRLNCLLTILYCAIIVSSCSKGSDPKQEPVVTANSLINQFIYDGMSQYYRWDYEIRGKKPAETDRPKEYFYSLLNITDSKMGWSFITDDVQGLIAELEGEPKEFGFSVAFKALNENNSLFVAVIRYVYPDSPADRAGIKRGDLIIKINGEDITKKTYEKFYNTATTSFTKANFIGGKYVQDKTINITPEKIKADPVLHKQIFNIDGNKIAYLFYTGFTYPYNSSLYKAFSEFKQAGITDLILDLRYNGGGSIGSALYLCSMFLPLEHVKNKKTLTILDYNNYLNSVVSNRRYNLGSYSSELFPNPLDVNLDLKKIYIIATSRSYSASELTIFCSKRYIDVIHIGSKTGGKYTASWTIHPFDNKIGQPIYVENKLSEDVKATYRNWAMQPIVAIYTDVDGNTFASSNGIIPKYEVTEGPIEEWKQLGDPSDKLLGKAIELITGRVLYAPLKRVHYQDRELDADMGRDPKKESLILDM